MIQLPISNKIMTTSAAKKVCQAILTHPRTRWVLCSFSALSLLFASTFYRLFAVLLPSFYRYWQLMVFWVEWGLVLGSITCALDENPLFLGIVALVEKQYLCNPKEPLYLTILQFTIYNFTIINSKLSNLNSKLNKRYLIWRKDCVVLCLLR